MLWGNNVLESCGTKFVWRSKWDVGGEADLSQPHANNGRFREREMEGEKGEKRALEGSCIMLRWTFTNTLLGNKCDLCIVSLVTHLARGAVTAW